MRIKTLGVYRGQHLIASAGKREALLREIEHTAKRSPLPITLKVRGIPWSITFHDRYRHGDTFTMMGTTLTFGTGKITEGTK